MGDVGDIKPLIPVWPKKPGARVGPSKRSPDSSANKKRPAKNNKEQDNDEDGQEHVDEYA